jgi:hypothetical protein
MIKFTTEDGYSFYLHKNGGRVSDSKVDKNADMAWPSLESFLKTMAEDGMGFHIIVGKSVLVVKGARDE